MNITHFSTNGTDYMGWDADAGQWVPVTQADYEATRSAKRQAVPDAVWGGLEALSQGLSLGASDEFAAAVGALPRLMPGGESYADAYQRIRDAQRARARQFQAQNPNTAMALESLGGAITGLYTGGAGMAGPTASIGRNVAQAATLGASEGYLAGLMKSDEKELDQALAGMGFGALVGAAAPAVAGALGSGATLAGRIARALTQSPDSKARRQARDLLEMMGMDEQMFAVRMRELGPDAVFADVSETAAQQLRAAAAANPRVMRAAEAVFEPRAAGSRERVLAAAQREMAPGSDVRLTTEIAQLDAMRRAQAQRDYPDVYAQTPPMSVELERILRNPRIQDAFDEAQRLRSYDLDAAPMPEIYVRRQDGTVDVNEYPTVLIWDDIKRGLDRIIERNTDEFGSANMEAREALKLKNRLLTELDDQIDGYRQARQNYAGTSALITAARQGNNIFKDEAEISVESLRGMTPGEREAYKIGAYNAVRDEIEATRLHGTPAARQKFATDKFMRRLRVAFDDDASFNRFRQQLDREMGMQRTRNIVLYGSDTARTLMAGQELGREMLDPTMMSSAEGFLTGVGRRVLDEMTNTPRSEVASSIYGRGLLGQLPEALEFVRQPVTAPFVPHFQPGAGTGALIGGAVTGVPQERQYGLTFGLLGL